jgi:hypothetical protein
VCSRPDGKTNRPRWGVRLGLYLTRLTNAEKQDKLDGGRAAAVVYWIVIDAKPVHLPVQQRTGFDFVASLKSAYTVELSIPPLKVPHTTELIQPSRLRTRAGEHLWYRSVHARR